MSAQDWSPEPWLRKGAHIEANGHVLCTFNATRGFEAPSIFGEEDEANAERARACVNALANVPDPEEAVRLAREALQAAAWHANTAEFHDRYIAALKALGGTP